MTTLIWNIYIIILVYFVLGGLSFYFINRNKEKDIANKSYTKFASYFVIIHILFFSIVIKPQIFNYIAIGIVLVGAYELINLYLKKQEGNTLFFACSFLVYTLLSLGFYNFSILPWSLILFSFLILSIFDSFSQINGQIWGKTKIMPSVSPNKTLGGLIGGSVFALVSSFFLKDLYAVSFLTRFLLALGLVFFSFWGDIAASFYKRRFGVKDYSNILPGHGGFLDRFDSLIAGGAWVALFYYVF